MGRREPSESQGATSWPLRQAIIDAALAPLEGLEFKIIYQLARRYVNEAIFLAEGRLVAYPSLDRLARDVGASARGVRKALAKLEAEGRIRRFIGGGAGKTNRYELIPPAPLRQTEAGTEFREKPGTEFPNPGTEFRENPELSDRKTLNSVPPTSRDLTTRDRKTEMESREPRAHTRAIPISDDWQAPEKSHTFGRSLGLSGDHIHLAAEKFKRHYKSKQLVSRDWNAEFEKWLIGDAEKHRAERPAGGRVDLEWWER